MNASSLLLMLTAPVGFVHTWSAIGGVAALAVVGEVLIAAAMRRLGDLDNLRTKPGLIGYLGPTKAVLGSPMFVCGSLCMALNFFAMLWCLSIVDLSLAFPATASLTYVGNAFAGKFVLKENVDRRRWLAVLFIVVGVVLISR